MTDKTTRSRSATIRSSLVLGTAILAVIVSCRGDDQKLHAEPRFTPGGETFAFVLPVDAKGFDCDGWRVPEILVVGPDTSLGKIDAHGVAGFPFPSTVDAKFHIDHQPPAVCLQSPYLESEGVWVQRFRRLHVAKCSKVASPCDIWGYRFCSEKWKRAEGDPPIHAIIAGVDYGPAGPNGCARGLTAETPEV